jgi:hypothetical protein
MTYAGDLEFLGSEIRFPWAGSVTRVGVPKDACRILMGKSLSLDDNTKILLVDMWMVLIQDALRWWAFVLAVRELWV